MYNRSHGRRRPPTIPQNYSGNAFYRIPYEEKPPTETECRELPPEPEPCVSECECPSQDECSDECKCKITEPPHEARPSLPFLGGKLFPHGIGNEELLILALILITAGNEDCTDLLLCLVLLLFC